MSVVSSAAEPVCADTPAPSGSGQARLHLFLSLAITAVLGIFLWSLYPLYLVEFDSANFALALSDFRPGAHQPQPPGYPLFVGLTQLLHLLLPDAERVFFAAGLLGIALTIFFLLRIGDEMIAPGAGFAAAVLFAANPALWSAALTSQVRVYLAVVAVLTVFLSRRALANPRLLAFAFVTLGLASGFRPETAALLLPLPLLAAYRLRLPLRGYLWNLALMAASTAAWVTVCAIRTGGFGLYFDLLRKYASEQTQSTSALSGAPAYAALQMLIEAVIWTGAGALGWLWILPLTRGPRMPNGIWLAVWLAPAFAFHALIHIGAPGHALISIPAVCLVGGWVITRIDAGWKRHAALAMAAGISAGLFFLPIPASANLFVEPLRVMTYAPIDAADERTADTIERVRALTRQDLSILAVYGDAVSWRILGYYFPDLPILVLDSDVRAAGEPRTWLVRNNRLVRQVPNQAAILPLCGRIAALIPDPPALRTMLAEPYRYRRQGLVWDRPAGGDFAFGPYRLHSDSAPCAGTSQ